jgi:excisionase family DNA binding protein
MNRATKSSKNTNWGLGAMLSLEEAGTLLRRSHWTLRRDIKAGRMRCIRWGGRILIEHTEVRRLIKLARQRTAS